MDLRRCPACHLTVELEEGRRTEAVLCRCGAMMPPTSLTAGMLACPFCSAPVERGCQRCRHCASQLKTLRCPTCFSLQFTQAKHCSNCGDGLEAVSEAHALKIKCPRCRDPLQGQPMAGSPVASCASCGGLWLDHATFGRVRDEHARVAEGLPPRTPGQAVSGAVPEPYLRCPACEKFMNRSNFARMSGVLLDSCRDHGLWFDANELQQVLDFIQRGGLGMAARREAAEQADRLRQLRVEKAYEASRPAYSSRELDSTPSGVTSLLEDLIRLFFR